MSQSTTNRFSPFCFCGAVEGGEEEGGREGNKGRGVKIAFIIARKEIM